MNIRNNFNIIGRLVRDPVIFHNSDGSVKVRFTLAAQDNFTSGEEKQHDCQFLPVEAFIPKSSVASKGLGVYNYLNKGDLIGVAGQIENNDYTDRTGVRHYELVLGIRTIERMETRAVREARSASRAAESVPA